MTRAILKPESVLKRDLQPGDLFTFDTRGHEFWEKQAMDDGIINVSVMVRTNCEQVYLGDEVVTRLRLVRDSDALRVKLAFVESQIAMVEDIIPQKRGSDLEFDLTMLESIADDYRAMLADEVTG